VLAIIKIAYPMKNYKKQLLFEDSRLGRNEIKELIKQFPINHWWVRLEKCG